MNSLPDNDRDLQLARQINACLIEGKSLSSLQDFLMPRLLTYKEELSSYTAQTNNGKNEVWKNIKIQTQSESTTRFFSLTNRRMWAAAAVVLIAAFISIMYIQFYDTPTLLAKSGSSIETVQLSDGTIIKLRPHSNIYTLKDHKNSELYRLEGEAFFDVASNPNRTFSIQTKQGMVTVLGTRFNLSTWSNQTQVFLEEGSVKVTDLKKQHTVVLKPGQSASIDKKTAIPQVRVGNISEFTDWLDQQLIFENKPVRLIVNELEQQFNISITLPKKVSGLTLSGQLSLKNLDSSLKDLEIVLGGKFTKTSNRTFIFEAN